MDREFDIIIHGATGFTGQLAMEHLLSVYGVNGNLKWAIAGRDLTKLQAVRTKAGAPADLSIIVADAHDASALAAMARRAKVIAAMAGPYVHYGSEIVAACAASGADYVDITGESHWMHAMLKHEPAAKASGARIVFSCGFDSIPFEFGVFFLQEAAKTKFGAPLPRISSRVRRLERGVRGGMSGGSLATIMASIAAMRENPAIAPLLANPFALTPGFKGPEQPDALTAYEDNLVGSWVAPFVMAPINAKSVHRANYLMGHVWGTDFKYDEMMMVDGPPSGGAPPSVFQDAANPPAPGEGPSKADREGGRYEILLYGQAEDGSVLRARVNGDMDPGAGSTARMAGESAVCLARDITRDETPGGMWTPASAMGHTLLRRLQADAGLSFQLEV